MFLGMWCGKLLRSEGERGREGNHEWTRINTNEGFASDNMISGDSGEVICYGFEEGARRKVARPGRLSVLMRSTLALRSSVQAGSVSGVAQKRSLRFSAWAWATMDFNFSRSASGN